MNKSALTIFITFLLILLVSCAARYKISDDARSIEPAWPFARGDLNADGAVESTVRLDRLNRLWLQKEGDKLAGPLTIYHNSLVYPGSRKRIRFYDLVTGKGLGSIKSRGTAQTGVVMQDTLAFYAIAPKKNRIYAINLAKRKGVWKAPLKDAASGPIIVNNRLIIGSGDGRLIAYEPESGEELWSFQGEGKFVAAPSYQDGKIYQPGDRGTLYVLDEGDGQELYRVELDEPLMTPAALGDKLYIAGVAGTVYALDLATGETEWKIEVGSQIWTSPTVVDDRVYITHSGGELLCIDAMTGREIWAASISSVVTASPLWINNRLVVGTLTGTVLLYDSNSGELLATEKVNGAVKYSPVTDGSRVYVATQQGRIICFGETNGQKDTSDN